MSLCCCSRARCAHRQSLGAWCFPGSINLHALERFQLEFISARCASCILIHQVLRIITPAQGADALKRAFRGNAALQDSKTYRQMVAILMGISHFPGGPFTALLDAEALGVFQGLLLASSFVIRIACQTAVSESDLAKLRKAVTLCVLLAAHTMRVAVHRIVPQHYHSLARSSMSRYRCGGVALFFEEDPLFGTFGGGDSHVGATPRSVNRGS